MNSWDPKPWTPVGNYILKNDFFFLKKGVKLKKPYQTCSPLEVAGWEKKESKKLLKKTSRNFVIRITKVKMKRKKNGWGSPQKTPFHFN